MSNKRKSSAEISAAHSTPVVATEYAQNKPPSDGWCDLLATQVMQTLWTSGESAIDLASQFDAVHEAMSNIGPRDEFEGIMAAQMIAAHNASMECFRRAMLPNQTILGRDKNLHHANKLMRSLSGLLDTFNKHRGRCQQKVVVEHVHVHPGSQAIVGIVEPNRGIAGGPHE